MPATQTAPNPDMAAGAEWPAGVAGALAVARTHGQWERAVELGDWPGALDLFERLGDLRDFHETRDPRLLEMRLWQAETRLRAGSPSEARRLLAVIEKVAGQSAESRLLAARLCYYQNDFEACASACAEAIVLCSSDPRSGLFGDIYRLWADAYCLLGEHARARALLNQILSQLPRITNPDIRALRQTVTDTVELEMFCALLSSGFSKGQRGRASLYHYSMACRDLGLYDRAIAAIRQRFLNTVEGETFGTRETPPRKSGWVADATVALRDLKKAMEAADTPFFLISGTLLGCVREGGIIGHDKDIDVGVMETPELDREAVHTSLSQCGVFLIKPYQNPALLRIQHANGVVIDVFWHRLEDGRIIHEGMKSKWWNTAFDLAPTAFLGETYLIPDDYPRYLGENYGDWERPDSDFETFVDTPNMIITNHDEMVWYYYCKLLDYYNLGKRAQFRKIFWELVRARPNDVEVKRIGYRVLEAIGELPAPHEAALS